MRGLAALLGALVVHGLVPLVVEHSDVRVLFPPHERVAITVVPPPPLPPPPAPEPLLPSPEPRLPRDVPPPTSTPLVEPPADPMPAAPTSASPPAGTPLPEPAPRSVMRLPRGPSTMDRVLGAGDPLAPSRASLERALDLQVDKPVSDKEAAGRAAVQALQADLADDAVSAGLADDYFRTLKGHVETQWHPEMAHLNDGGASTTQLGMMRGLVEDTAAWGEMWQAYMDLAKQYANGEQPRLEIARRERLRELMRSRKGAFRVHAISELKLTQDPEGKLLLLELPLPSGHPNIDEGMREAVVQALRAMVDPPPSRVHHGRSFSSWWRLRATWTMVPPTAFLTGAGFDMTPKGFTVDVPFEIKLTTNVILLRTDARTSINAEGSPE